jgi:hypothetical protein
MCIMEEIKKDRVIQYPMKCEMSLLNDLKAIMKQHGYRQLAPFIRMILYKFLSDQNVN